MVSLTATLLFPLLATLSATASAQSVVVPVTYDQGYDQAARSLNSVACSNGANGLITKYHWQTQGNVPNFPYIGGTYRVAGWNSPNCGGCYSLTYKGKTINITAVDHCAAGFNIALEAMNELTGGKAVQLGKVSATWKRVGLASCDF